MIIIKMASRLTDKVFFLIRQWPWPQNFKVKWYIAYVLSMQGPICTKQKQCE